MDNTIRFWGVRGSTPSPGASTAVVGGNTSCVEVKLGGEQLIIDGGTGLRVLGAAEGGRPMDATILFSHLHWDHIQGIPFFAPLYHPSSRITLVGPIGLRRALRSQMSQPTFPVGTEVFGAKRTFIEIEPGEQLDLGEVKVMTAPLNHPGGAIGYRLTSGGTVSVAYLCDHEETDDDRSSGAHSLARGARALICDAQYTPEEYDSKIGWGHSTFEHASMIAKGAGATALYLTHHEPTRSDDELDRIELRAREIFRGARVAREGIVESHQSGRQVAMGLPKPSMSTQV